MVIIEYKSSASAPISGRQSAVFDALKNRTGEIVGEGKGAFTGGVQVPAGVEVYVVRPGQPLPKFAYQ